MKKYALLTIHDTQNFGSCLQTYSLWRAIDSCGCDIELIDYKNDAIWNRECSHLVNIFSSPKKFIRYVLWGKDQKEKLLNIRTFLRKNTKMSDPYNRSTIDRANEKYDVFVTGSDIVWGLVITGNDLTYFLDFTEERKKRIAFSSSIGTRWSKEEEQIIRPLVRRYHSIALREKESISWIDNFVDIDVTSVCDPTNLWDCSFWSEFLLENYAPKKEYVLIYLLHNDGRNLKDGIDYARKHNLDVYYISFYDKPKGVNVVKPKNVNEWITLIARARVVFTASFHGTLFSMYFNTPVFYYNRGAKSRLNSLASDIGILHREGNEKNIYDDREIDFKYVHKVLDTKRNESWKILKEVL